MSNALLIINPQSGTGKKNDKKTTYIEKFLKKNHISLEIFYTKTLDDVYHHLVSKPLPQIILVMGGDGTINHLINDLIKIKEKLGLATNNMPKILILSHGTSNDISKILTIPKNIKQALSLIIDNQYELVDINKINDKYFFFCSAYGFLTDVSFTTPQNLKQKYGYLAYLHHGIKLIKEHRDFSLTINYNTETIKIDNAFLALVLSGNEFGSLKIDNFDHRTKLNDGLIELRVFLKGKTSRLSKMLSFILHLGKQNKNEYHLQANKFVIELYDKPQTNWNIDGEAGPFSDKAVFEVLPKALPFYLGTKSKKKFF